MIKEGLKLLGLHSGVTGGCGSVWISLSSKKSKHPEKITIIATSSGKLLM